MAAAKRKNEKAQDATDKASCFSWHWLVVGVVAVLVPLCGLGIRDLANLSSRETTWKEHRAAERLTSRDVSFDEYPATIKAESHRDVGLVYHPHAGGYLVQVQKPLPSNTSLLRIPYDAVLDAETACEVWPDFCTAVNSESQELAQALATGFKVTLSDDAKVRALGRLKLMAALLRLRWASVNQTTGRSKPIALSGNARRHLPWVKTVLMRDREVSTDMQLLPDVASKCLTGADRNSWITATSMLAAERKAIMRVITALKGADDELDISLDDVAWASAVIRRRSWLRPAPFFFALVPLVDLNDQRTGDGDKSALRLDRDVTATVAFDDASKRAHLVLSDNVTRGAYPIVRGDDDGAFPMMASSTVRRYGFFDNQSTALPSHASPLFADLDRSLNCHVDKALYFNATTASPSPLLRQCVEALTGKPNKVLKFLSFHATRAAKELYDPQSMFACESFVSKGKTSSKRAVEQAEMQLAAFHHTRQGLLEVARRLQAEP